MKKYDTYKDSGIEWIGKIPEHWETKRFSYVIALLTDYTANGSFASLASNVKYFHEKNYSRLIRLTDLREDLANEGIWVDNHAHEYLSKSELFGGELLMANVGAYAGFLCIMPEIDHKATLAPNMFLIKLKDNVLTKFIYYLLSSFHYSIIISNKAQSSAQPKLNKDDIKEIILIIPTFPEQTAIATYLDRKTAEIDELIADKKRMLELYEEEKTAIINHAVTKGINPDVPMKDSGIEWLGKIPEHWEIKRLRYLGWCQNGIGISSDSFGKGYPFVSYSDVGNNESLPYEVSGLVESSSDDREKYSVKEGDVFFTRTSETIEEIAFASTCLKTIENAVFAGFLIRWRPFEDTLINGFKKYYFIAQVHRRFFVKEMNLVTRASLSQELLKKLPVLIPPKDEQQSIVQYIEIECSRIDTQIKRTQKLIKLLTEYRTALISEVVTGKVKVTE